MHAGRKKSPCESIKTGRTVELCEVWQVRMGKDKALKPT